MYDRTCVHRPPLGPKNGGSLFRGRLCYKTSKWDLKIVADVDSWSLFGGHLCYIRSNWDLKTVAVVDKWSLLGGGR